MELDNLSEAGKRAVRILSRSVFHTIPIRDTFIHLASKDCCCMPTTKNGGKIYSHYAFDARDEKEQANPGKSFGFWDNVAEYVALEDV